MHHHISRRTFLWQSAALSSSLILPACSTSAGPDQDKPALRFGLVTDSHYADREHGGTRYYRESLDKMRECINVMNEEGVDFVIHLGDFKDQRQDPQPENTLNFLKALEAEYAQFKGPKYHCVGNHDVDSITKQQFLDNIENTGIAKTESYYSFEQNGFRFIVLDANYHPDGRDHFYMEGADWQKTIIPQKELEWLEQTLKNTQLPIIVFCHHPLYQYPGGEAIFHVGNYEAVQQLLESSGKVVSVFHGHVHADDYQLVNGIHYTTFLGMVDYSGPENNAYAIVEVYPEDKIEVVGYRREPNRVLV